MTHFSQAICIAIIAFLQLHHVQSCLGGLQTLFDPSRKLFHVDFPVLQYQMEVARRFYETSGFAWGYDPFFLNGFPHSFLWNSNALLQVLANVFSQTPAHQIPKAVIFTCIAITPFLIYAAMRNFGVRREASLWCTLLAVLYLNLAQAVIFLVIGMPTAYLIISLFLYAMSVLYRIASSEAPIHLIVSLPFLLAVCLLVHKTFLILAAPVCLVIGSKLVLELDYRRVIYFVGSFAFAFAANTFWIWPAFNLKHYVDFSYNSFFRDPSEIRLMDVAMLQLDTPLAVVNGTYLVMAAILLLAALGLYRLVADRRLLIAGTITLTTTWLLFLIFFGNEFPLFENLHGRRFWSGLGTVLCVPAACWLDAVFDKPLKRYLGVGALIGLAVVGTALPSYQTAIATSIESGEALFQRIPLFAPEDTPAIEEASQLREWLVEHVAPSEKVFVSTFPGNHYLFGLYVGSGIRFISAPYNHIFLKHNYVNRYFQDFFRGELQPSHLWGDTAAFERDPEDFEELARFFNVHWWVIDRVGSEVDLTAFPGMQHVESVASYDIYRYEQPMTDFLIGSGDLEIEYGRIVIRNAKAVDSTIVLKMNYFEGFKAIGAGYVGPRRHEDFPVPFTLIYQPESTVELRY